MDTQKVIDDIAKSVAELSEKPTVEVVREIITNRLLKAGIEVVAETVDIEIDLAEKVVAFFDDNAITLEGEDGAAEIYKAAKDILGQGAE